MLTIYHLGNKIESMKNPVIQKAIQIAGTQDKLSIKSGVSQAAIHKLLTMKSRGMRLSTAKALSDATGIKLEDFVSQ